MSAKENETCGGAIVAPWRLQNKSAGRVLQSNDPTDTEMSLLNTATGLMFAARLPHATIAAMWDGELAKTPRVCADAVSRRLGRG